MVELLQHYAVQDVSHHEHSVGFCVLFLLLTVILRFLNAHETTAAEAFAIALLCGDVRADVRGPLAKFLLFNAPLTNLSPFLFQMYSGVLILDGNRVRFAMPDWKTMLVMKVLRARLREVLARAFKNPGKLPTAQHEKWLDVWQRIFSQEFGDGNNKGAVMSSKAGAA